jgi:2-polyprenyl-3-methyl-5-hydroxy-6-metoxy-1,4-benzoquinol methylase
MGETSAYSSHLFVRGTRNNSWSNMLSFIPEGSRVLDVGCSAGNFGEALEQMNSCTVVGVDLNPVDIDEARGKISEAYVLDVSDTAAVAGLGTFDVVLFADVLEHLPDPRATLVAIRALLRPGGVVVYSIPNMGHLSVRLDLLEGRFTYTETGLLDKTHLHFYDAFEIEDVFTAAGYGIREEDPVVSEYPQRWVTERLAGLGLTADEKFFELLKATDSHVYQYVGVAIPLASLPRNTAPIRTRVTPPDEILGFANRIAAENEALKNTDAALVAAAQARLEAELLATAKTAALAERDSATAELAATVAARDALAGEVAGLRAHLTFMKTHPVAFLTRKIVERFPRAQRKRP